jgi:hypothetical protein
VDLSPGAVAYWHGLYGQGKFIYLIGVCEKSGDVFWFPISSQTKWCQLKPHCREMVEVPRGTVDYLTQRSFIQCFFELHRTPVGSFQELERKGYINWRGLLPRYLPSVRAILVESTLLSEYDIEDALRVIPGD